MRTITIDPLTRLEGHGRVEIFLDDAGAVANAYLQIPELRGFEEFCKGRQAEEMPLLTSRICGLCPEAHLMASVKALDDLFMVKVPRAGYLIRELLYHTFFVIDHSTHFYALGGPDLFLGPDAPPAQRNLFGVIQTLGADAGKMVIDMRRRNTGVLVTIGGRGVHGTGAVPGGWSKHLSPTERDQIKAVGKANVEFALTSLALLESKILSDPSWREVILGNAYVHHTYSMGTVDAAGRSDPFDGEIRVVDPDGGLLTQYKPRDYTAHVAERVEPWSYMAFPYLKDVGWKGFVDGADSGVYVVGPLARLNVTDGMSTPKAHEQWLKFHEYFGTLPTGGGRRGPVHYRLATHWARMIEVLASAEKMVEITSDEEICSPHVREIPSGQINPDGGIGSIEAPRGTLTHHYTADSRGVLTGVNMVVGTTNNNAAMSMSVRQAAVEAIGSQALTPDQDVDQGLLNRVEMAMRLYDPCLSCATHALPGRMPLLVTLRAADGSALRTIRRDG